MRRGIDLHSSGKQAGSSRGSVEPDRQAFVRALGLGEGRNAEAEIITIPDTQEDENGEMAGTGNKIV